MTRSLLAIVRSPASGLAAILLACAGTQPSEGYAPFRGDATPEAEARAACQDRAKFRDRRGTEWIDWKEFEACMEEHGYRKS